MDECGNARGRKSQVASLKNVSFTLATDRPTRAPPPHCLTLSVRIVLKLYAEDTATDPTHRTVGTVQLSDSSQLYHPLSAVWPVPKNA